MGLAPLTEPPVRMEDGLDVSYRDVPYPVVPAFTRRCVVHLAVECQGVVWNRGRSIRVYVRTKCGKRDMPADRRCMSWTAECRTCFRSVSVLAVDGAAASVAITEGGAA